MRQAGIMPPARSMPYSTTASAHQDHANAQIIAEAIRASAASRSSLTRSKQTSSLPVEPKLGSAAEFAPSQAAKRLSWPSARSESGWSPIST